MLPGSPIIISLPGTSTYVPANYPQTALLRQGRSERMSGSPRKRRSPSGKAAAPAPATKAMKATGQSVDWVSSMANHVRIANLFLAHVADTDSELSTRWGASWTEVPEVEAAQQEIYSHLATYLVDTYTISEKDRNQGKHIAVGTAHGIWRGLINERRQALSKGQPDTQASCSRLHAAARAAPAGATRRL